jgi:membrane fusion protein, multidrug efflux system
MRRSPGVFVGLAAVAFGLIAATTACSNGSAEPATTKPAIAVVQLAPENVATATILKLSSGPAISGELTPAREATVRAQVGGSIIALSLDRGQNVRAGAEIARISSRDLDQAMSSAQAGVKSAESALAVARTEQQRTATLVKGGALAARDLEQAQNAVSVAEAQLAAAKARERSAWQQLDDTSVKAPFAGIVSERASNLGDVVSPGTAILTIIDPTSMRLEALVPSDEIDQVRPGVRVRFTIRGVPNQTFTGTVDRLSPIADPVTRQVSIFVTLPNSGGKLIAGLFAQGRVETTTREGVVVPLSAVDETGASPTVTRVRDGKAERVNVELGLKQTETEQVEIIKGVSAGDLLIVGSAKGVAAGTPISIVGK